MRKCKIIKIENDRVYYTDEYKQPHDFCLFNIMDNDVIHRFSLEDQALIAEESVNDGFYAAKTRTDQKILVSLRRERYLPFFVALMVAATIMSIFASIRVIHINSITLFGGFLFFPLVFACTDIINELYGYARVQRVIYSLVIVMLIMAFLMAMNLGLPGSLEAEKRAMRLLRLY